MVLSRRFLKLTVLFALAHFLLLFGLGAAIYLCAHLPTSIVHLDGFIVALTHVHQWLRVPRTILSHLWPGEYLPRLLNLGLTVVNSLIWGVTLAALKMI